MKKFILSVLLVLVICSVGYALDYNVNAIPRPAIPDFKVMANNTVSVNTAQALDLNYSTYMFSNGGNFNNGSVTTVNYIWPAPTYTLATTNVKEGTVKILVKTTAAATANVVITPAAAAGFTTVTLAGIGDTCTLIKKSGKWYKLDSAGLIAPTRIDFSAAPAAVDAAGTTANYQVTVNISGTNYKILLRN